MAEIKKSYNSVGEQIYLQTHEKAVVDNNGTTAETKFQMITDLVNQKQMEVGAVPSDLTPTEDSTNWVTSGGLYDSIYKDKLAYFEIKSGSENLTANQTKVIDDNIGFEVGEKYKVNVSIPSAVANNVGVYVDSAISSGTLFQIGRITAGETSAEIIYIPVEETNYQYLTFYCANAVTITYSISKQNVGTFISTNEIDNSFIGGNGKVAGATEVKNLYTSVYDVHNRYYFEKGGIFSGVDGYSNVGLRSTYIPVKVSETIEYYLAQGIPAASSTWLVFYKNKEFVRSEQQALNNIYTINPSDDYDEFRVVLYRDTAVTEEQAAASYFDITPEIAINRIDELEKVENRNYVYAKPNELISDLSFEVLDLSNQTATNQRFNASNLTIVNDSYWRLISVPLEAIASPYWVVDNVGTTYYSQIAYVKNGNIVKVHGESYSSGNFVSNYFINSLEADGLLIAVKTTSLNGLHVVRKRKLIIQDEARRNAFDKQCADGKINVAFIDAPTANERILTALRMAGDFGTIWIPSGRYEVTSTIYAVTQNIELATDASIVASSNFSDNYLLDWACPLVDITDPSFPNAYGEASSFPNSRISGGVFDAMGKCGCVRITNFRGFKIDHCQFYNAATNGLSVERPGYECIVSQCAARNDIAGLAGNIGFNINCNDCHFSDLITVNYNIGFKFKSANALVERCHPWIGRLDFATYYPNSIGFDMSESSTDVLTECYSDTMQTHYKCGDKDKLIGCVGISYSSDIFPIQNYGNVNLIHNDYNNVALVGCQFNCTGTTKVSNSGSKEPTVVACGGY